MAIALAILQLLNAAAPGIAQLIISIRAKTGGVTTVEVAPDGGVIVRAQLDENDTTFQADVQQAAEWFKTHSNIGGPK